MKTTGDGEMTFTRRIVIRAAITICAGAVILHGLHTGNWDQANNGWLILIYAAVADLMPEEGEI